MISPRSTYNLSLIKAPKIHTDLLWDLSVLFIGLSVIYFIIIFYYRNKLAKVSKLIRERKMELSPMISEFIFYEDDATKDEKSNYVQLKIEIRELIKDKFNRKVLSDVLLDLRKDVSGDAQKRLFDLYQDLGLHTDAFDKLKSWRWEKVSKAIIDLTQMEVDEAYGFIIKFINDKRSTIRKQAEIATVTLKTEGINHFLDCTKYKISEWQQLKLLDVIRNQENYEAPQFKAWLTSTNSNVVLFALRLIKFYNQNDANASLIELVKHKNNQIKEEAIACIKEFYVIEALDTLKLIFWKSSTDIKIAILDTIGELGTEEDIEFLKLIEKKISNFSVKSKAWSSINAISPESIMPTQDIVDTSGYEIPDDLPESNELEIPKSNEKLDAIPIISGDKEVSTITEEAPKQEFQEAKTETVEAKENINEIQEEALPALEANIPTNNEEAHEVMEESSTEKEAPSKSENQVSKALTPEIINETPLNTTTEPLEKEDIIAQIKQNAASIPEENNKATEIEEEIISEEKESNTPASQTQINFDFLPIVIDKNISQTDRIPNQQLSSEEINELQGAFDEILNEQAGENANPFLEESQNWMETKPKEEFTTDALSFLPIVIEKVLGNSKDNQAKEPKEQIVIDDFKVVYEIVEPELIVEENIEENISFTNSDTNALLNFDDYNRTEILNIETVFEEVKADKGINQITVIDPDFLSSSNTKGNKMDDESNIGTTNNELPEEMNPLDEQKFKEIINNLFDFKNNTEEKEVPENDSTSPLLEFENEYIDIRFIPIVNHSTDDLHESEDEDLKNEESEISNAVVDKNDISKTITDSEKYTLELLEDQNSSEEIEINEEDTSIQNSKINRDADSEHIIDDVDHEESTMQLLDDLEEMGDHREVVLLNEMLVNVKYKTVKARVENLISRFSEEETEPITVNKSKTDFLLRPFNVFEDLFRTCDTEAKLILLDEVVAIGDQSEVAFLERLLHDDEEVIQHKAAKTLEELRLKLTKTSKQQSSVNLPEVTASIADDHSIQEAGQNEETLLEYTSLMEELKIEPSPEVSEIFDVDFEFGYGFTANETEGNQKLEKVKRKRSQNSIIDQLYKIIEKLNG